MQAARRVVQTSTSRTYKEIKPEQQQLVSKIDEIKLRVNNDISRLNLHLTENTSYDYRESIKTCCSNHEHDLKEVLHKATILFQEDDLDKYTCQISEMRSQLSTLTIRLYMATFSLFFAKAERAENHFQVLDFCEIASTYLCFGADGYTINNEKLYDMELKAIQNIKNSKTKVTTDNITRIKSRLGFINKSIYSTNNQKAKASTLLEWLNGEYRQ